MILDSTFPAVNPSDDFLDVEDFTISESDDIDFGALSPVHVCNTDIKYRVDSSPSATSTDSPRVLGLLEAGPDWCTLSTVTHKGSRNLAELGESVLLPLLDDGDMIHDARQLGYAGWRCGGSLFYGERTDGAMLRGSSVSAVALVDRLRRRPELLEDVRVTRFDLQTTVQLEELDREYLLALGRQADDFARNRSGRGRPFKVHNEYNHGRGDTLELGDRRTKHFGRCYDKHKEDPKFYEPGALRYEYEAKAEPARELLMGTIRAKHDTSFVVSHVKRRFGAWGVDVPVDPRVQVELVKSPTHIFDMQRSRDWHKRCVRPSVSRVRRAGLSLEETLADLGLLEEVLRKYGR